MTPTQKKDIIDEIEVRSIRLAHLDEQVLDVQSKIFKAETSDEIRFLEAELYRKTLESAEQHVTIQGLKKRLGINNGAD